jgi:hypothetical protein
MFEQIWGNTYTMKFALMIRMSSDKKMSENVWKYALHIFSPRILKNKAQEPWKPDFVQGFWTLFRIVIIV